MKFLLQPCWVIGLTLLSHPVKGNGPAVVASLSPADLVEYETQPPQIQALIEAALSLTEKKLYYRFGSNSPDLGGMDCSGAVQYTLIQVNGSHEARHAHHGAGRPDADEEVMA